MYHPGNRYRNNRQDEVKNKRVLVIGNSFTAGDISDKIAEVADKVRYIAVHTRNQKFLEKNVSEFHS